MNSNKTNGQLWIAIRQTLPTQLRFLSKFLEFDSQEFDLRDLGHKKYPQEKIAPRNSAYNVAGSKLWTKQWLQTEIKPRFCKTSENSASVSGPQILGSLYRSRREKGIQTLLFLIMSSSIQPCLIRFQFTNCQIVLTRKKIEFHYFDIFRKTMHRPIIWKWHFNFTFKEPKCRHILSQFPMTWIDLYVLVLFVPILVNQFSCSKST